MKSLLPEQKGTVVQDNNRASVQYRRQFIHFGTFLDPYEVRGGCALTLTFVTPSSLSP